jgi:DNA-binding XRE family transcriptional regulator
MAPVTLPTVERRSAVRYVGAPERGASVATSVCREGETTSHRGGFVDVGCQTVLAVSGSMVQNRKSPRGPGQNKILELRSQRQADAANPSEWTQAGLAQKVGASVRSVKAWEAGDTLPRLFYRRRLAKALSVSVSDLGFLNEP